MKISPLLQFLRACRDNLVFKRNNAPQGNIDYKLIKATAEIICVYSALGISDIFIEDIDSA